MIKRLFFLTGVAFAITGVLRRYVFDTIYVASASMTPTLEVGTHFLVNRLAYRSKGPERGDIIVFRSPVDHTSGYIKRVIAVPGDQIELRDKKVILNGKHLEEPYTVYKRATESLSGDTIPAMAVPADSVFVLGDNRDESYDSTSWKDTDTGQRIYFLPYSHIKGRLVQFL